MLIPLMGLYLFGGFVGLIFLGIQYLRFAFLKRRRTPWSYLLGAGLIILAIGCGLTWYSNYTPKQNYSWQDGWGVGFWLLSWLVFIVGAVICLFTMKHAPKSVETISYVEQEGVWPPAPDETLGHQKHQDQ